MSDFEAVFVDIGEGDSTFIKLPGGQYALVDVFRCEDHGTVDLYRLLDDRLPNGSSSKKRLDYLIITHAHDDHIRGLGKLYDRYEVGELWLPQHGYKKSPGDQYAEFERVQKEHPKSDIYWPKGSRSPWRYLGENNEVTVRCFSPPGYIDVEEELDEDEATRLIHENCMALKFEYKGVSVMLTGDSNLPAWERIVGYYKDQSDENDLGVLKTQVLHASHHGSRTFVKNDEKDKAWTDALDAIDPERIVISVGEKNKHDHPHKDMIKIYEKQASAENVLQTMDSGTFVLRVTGKDNYELQSDTSYAAKYGWDHDDDDGGGSTKKAGVRPPGPPPPGYEKTPQRPPRRERYGV